MAPTGSDETTTDLAEPDTANASSDNASSSTDTPFGDWREQLRERVKEIRARKHAVHREDVEEIAAQATTTAEDRLEVARAQSADPQSVDDLSVQLVGGERTNRRAEIADLVDDLLGGPEPAAEMPAADPVEAAAAVEAVPEEPLAEAPAAPEVAPLFQAEPTVYADDPILEIADEFAHRTENAEALTADDEPTETELVAAVEAPIESEAAPEPEPEPEPEAEPDVMAGSEDAVVEAEVGAEVEVAMEAETDGSSDEPALPIDNTPLRDRPALAAIPPELRDVDIPAWALPREPSRTPRAGADTEISGVGEDNFLVGEYTTHEGGKRTDLGPPPDTPIPTADMLDKSIGDLSASSEESLPVEAVEIAPPGSLVDAADFEPGDREAVPEATNPLPGLFDLEDVPSGDDTAKPNLFFDEPLVKAPAVEEIPEDAGEQVAERVPEEEPTEAIAAERSTPVPFLDETVAEAEPAESAPEQKPDPIGFLDNLAADPGPAETQPDDVALAETVAAEEPTPIVPLDDEVASAESLEWDVEDDADAELVADARRQFADSSAPMSDRVYSAIADAMVLLTIGLVLMIAGASAAGSPVVPFVRAAPLPFLAAWSLFGLIYGVIFVGTCGQTLGKMAMRVRVIGADTFHVGYGRAALRAVAYAAATLPAGLGLLTAIKDPERRGLHDRLTSTRVVKA